MELTFQAHTALQYNPDRYQPQVFLADDLDVPFDVPRHDGHLFSCELGDRPSAALHIRWSVPAFGEVTLPTGSLPPAGTPYNLNVEIARERIHRVTERMAAWSADGFRPSEECLRLLMEARRVLGYVNDTESDGVNARWGDLSLSSSVRGGELLALERAESGLARRKSDGALDSFRLGCNFFQYPGCDPRYAERFAEAFNFATLPFYWARFEPNRGDKKWEVIDSKLEWLEAKGIKSKGHPLMWLQQLPDWIDPNDTEELLAQLRPRITEIVTRYRGRIPAWDIVNELQRIPDQHFAHRLTRLASEAVHEADPDAVRIVNCDDPFAEYMAAQSGQGVHSLDYFRNIIHDGIDFEVMGVQVYHGAAWTYARDLFEMSRYFDKFEAIGKELHVSELGVPSAEGIDTIDFSSRGDDRFDGGGRWKASDAGYWHGPWDEKNQADWVEGFYKILMSKPFINAITWWDLADATPHFYTHAGMLRENWEPKEVFRRILNLRRTYLA